MGTFGGPIIQRETDSYGEWVKIFRHRSTDYAFYSSNDNWAEAKQTNTSTPNADKYSILASWGKFLRNGKYTLKLNYPVNGVVNIWSQTSNPVDSDGSGGVTGYTAISIESTSSGWGGLERYDSQSATFLDGTLVPQGNWWWAIGSKNNYDTGNPNYPGPGSVTELCELWILNKPA
jgi:hypothetical protein